MKSKMYKLLLVLAVALMFAGCQTDSRKISKGADTAPLISVRQGTTAINSGASFAMDIVDVNQTGEAVEFTISNTGNTDLNLTSALAVMASGDTEAFTIVQPTEKTIKAAASSVFTVTFAPTEVKNYSITITIASNDEENPEFSFIITAGSNIDGAVVITSTAGNYTNVSTIPITITFASDVSGLTEGDLNISNATKGTLKGSGSVYTMDITANSNGIITVDIAAGAAKDGTGKDTVAATQFSIVYDNIVPTIVSISPADAEVDVALASIISVSFSEAMDTTSITTNKTDTTCSGSLQISKDNFITCVQMTSSPVASIGNTVFTLTPATDLVIGSVYKIKLSTTVKDIAANTISEYISTTGFTTLRMVLVKDINSAGDSFPEYLVDVGGTLFFSAYDDSNGKELWKSDGTKDATVIVKDINPGTDYSSPSNLTVVGSTLFFTANDGTNGKELWKSDGTEGGTVMVKDIYPGSSGASPEYLTVVGSTLFFTANDGTNGKELWKSDGTESGTVMVKNIRTAGDDSSPNSLVDVGGTLFFSAYDATNEGELWKSDGTESGTVMVKDINPSGNSFPSDLIVVGGTLFFSAYDGTNGRELWKSDGTSGGTTMVKDINSAGDSSPEYFVDLGGALLFRANDGTNGVELWKSDGTSGGTTMVKDIYSGSSGSWLDNLTVVGSTLFFTADNGTNGYELWESNGTSGGTTMVKDIRSGIANSSSSRLANVGGTLFFRADNGTNGDELWKSDGTESGTVMVKDINSAGDSSPDYLTDVGGKLFFKANDGVNGAEIWLYVP